MVHRMRPPDSCGRRALGDRSFRPLSCPHGISEANVAEVRTSRRNTARPGPAAPRWPRGQQRAYRDTQVFLTALDIFHGVRRPVRSLW